MAIFETAAVFDEPARAVVVVAATPTTSSTTAVLSVFRLTVAEPPLRFPDSPCLD
jgi:hypothetical protein